MVCGVWCSYAVCGMWYVVGCRLYSYVVCGLVVCACGVWYVVCGRLEVAFYSCVVCGHVVCVMSDDTCVVPSVGCVGVSMFCCFVVVQRLYNDSITTDTPTAARPSHCRKPRPQNVAIFAAISLPFRCHIHCHFAAISCLDGVRHAVRHTIPMSYITTLLTP